MWYDSRRTIYSNPGTGVRNVYTPIAGTNGKVDLVISGKENFQEYIDSFKESTDINVIVQRVANGEAELLKKRPGTFGDFSQAPKTLLESLQLQLDANRMFEQLPADKKKLFDNDRNQFFAQAGSKEWYDKLGDQIPGEVKDVVRPPVPVDKEEGVKE